MKHKYRLTVNIYGDPTRYIYFINARNFMAAITIFETSSTFDGYVLISVEKCYGKI
jgi:hypothetical protein